MANIAELLRAFVVGGADFGQRREARQERNALAQSEEADALARRRLLEAQIKASERTANAPAPTPVRPTPYKVSHGGVSGDFETPDEALGFRERLNAIQPAAPAETPAPRTISRSGRTFDDTPEGARSALDWEREVAGAGRAPERPPAPPSSPETLNPTESDRRAAAVLPRAQAGFAEIQRLTQKFGGAPGVASALRSGIAGRFFQSEDTQRFRAAAQQVATAILRWESGGSITESEVQQQAEGLIPQPGEKPEVVAYKLRVLESQLRALEQSAGLVTSRMPGMSAAPTVSTPALPDDPDEAARLYPGRGSGPGPRR